MPRHARLRLLITHEVAIVPPGGSAVYRQLTALSRSYWKEAAGHVHLLFALKQAGLYSEQRRWRLLGGRRATSPCLLHIAPGCSA